MNKITLTCSAFGPGMAIPKLHTGEGPDTSPQLSWSDLPPNTRELALIVDDPDAPTPQPWVHWVLYKIPSALSGLPAGIAKTAILKQPPGALQGETSWGKVGYFGPLPPKGHGVHHYYFKLFALDQPLSLAAGVSKEALLAAMRGHVLGEGELIGTYERK